MFASLSLSILILQVIVGVSLVKIAFKIKEISFNRLKEQIGRGQVSIEGSFVPVTFPNRTTLQSRRAMQLQTISRVPGQTFSYEMNHLHRTQEMEMNQQLSRYFNQQREINPNFTDIDLECNEESCPAHDIRVHEPPPKYSEQQD